MINVDSNIHEEGMLTASEAAARLGVRKETLYAYVSRGLLRRYGGARSRGSRYARADIERLATRRDARAGHAAVAAGALRWGEPVLDTELSLVDARGPAYRGKYAVDLVREGASFESVAEWLWRGVWDPDARWAGEPAARARVPPSAPAGAGVTDSLMATTLAFAPGERPSPPPSEEIALVDARRLVRALAAALDPSAARGAYRVAEGVAASVHVAPTRANVSTIDAALVLLADHELNASSFAARVAASTGAMLRDCVLAALATASGPRHGTASRRVIAIAAEIRSPRRARRELERRVARGDDLPGFGHPLYPGGDPRAGALLGLAARLASPSSGYLVVRAMASAVRAMGGPPPNVDLGLAALALALRAPDAGPLLFLVSRSAGWIAHALEQRRAGFLLRPRARYVGRPPEALAR
jgi:citrate synthase